MPHTRETNQLLTHFFRHEAGRMVSVLTCQLGFDRLELAEDIVQDTMVQALRSWPFRGIPDNPSAWLYRVARNKALDWIRREQSFRALSPAFQYEQETSEWMPENVFENDVTDSQLRMLFACCHPAIAFESQVAMCLKILCGLNVREIASAFLVSEETIQKRLYRARERVRGGEIRLDVPNGPELTRRLEAVQKSIYLLFNEGYASSNPDELIRRDLCEEAMRLCLLLTEYPLTARPPVNAQMALFCFQAARFDTRLDAVGDIILLPEQDRSRWSQPLIEKGRDYLNRSAEGDTVSEYHLEAAIAMLHATAPAYETTDWPQMLLYYDALMRIKPSSVVAMNRAVVVAEVRGVAQALNDLSEGSKQPENQYYYSILATLYDRLGLAEEARRHYRKALELTTSTAEKRLLQHRIERL